VPPADGFPRVLKPVHSKVVVGDRLVTLAVTMVRDEASRHATLAAWLPFTAVQEQDWVPGHGVGVEMLYERGRLAWHFVHERLHEWPLTGGASTLRRAAGAEEELVRQSSRLLDALHWHGVAMVEWRRGDDGIGHLMEINPRPWGSLPLTIAAGVDIPRGMLALARGEPLGSALSWRVGARARTLGDAWQSRAHHRGSAAVRHRPVRVVVAPCRCRRPGERGPHRRDGPVEHVRSRARLSPRGRPGDAARVLQRRGAG
jgi:predicted ATP-grasp superfamily ATP-dependent carboligase